MNKTVETIIKSFPLVFATLTVLGYICLQSFYSFFGIELINYLELSEIPLLFYNKSIIIVAILFLVFLLSYYLSDKLDEDQNELKRKIDLIEENDGKFKILNQDRNSENFKFNKIKKRIEIIIAILLFYLIISNLIRENYIGLLFPVGYILCAIIVLIAEKTILKILIKKLNTISIISIYTSFTALVFFNLYIITKSIENGYSLKYGDSNPKNIAFDYNNGKIKTDKSIVYVGETRNNLFLFDRNNSKTFIYKKGKIENYIIRLNHSKNDTTNQLSIDVNKSIDSIKVE
ncbi:MAG: hypothetical protein P8P55_05670 [Flavobacteriaceae bacterium]|jgi:hypothetical protein|nr:hypothetical protein [Flavobacteriaceae bacterium]